MKNPALFNEEMYQRLKKQNTNDDLSNTIQVKKQVKDKKMKKNIGNKQETKNLKDYQQQDEQDMPSIQNTPDTNTIQIIKSEGQKIKKEKIKKAKIKVKQKDEDEEIINKDSFFETINQNQDIQQQQDVINSQGTQSIENINSQVSSIQGQKIAIVGQISEDNQNNSEKTLASNNDNSTHTLSNFQKSMKQKNQSAPIQYEDEFKPFIILDVRNLQQTILELDVMIYKSFQSGHLRKNILKLILNKNYTEIYEIGFSETDFVLFVKQQNNKRVLRFKIMKNQQEFAKFHLEHFQNQKFTENTSLSIYDCTKLIENQEDEFYIIQLETGFLGQTLQNRLNPQFKISDKYDNSVNNQSIYNVLKQVIEIHGNNKYLHIIEKNFVALAANGLWYCLEFSFLEKEELNQNYNYLQDKKFQFDTPINKQMMFNVQELGILIFYMIMSLNHGYDEIEEIVQENLFYNYDDQQLFKSIESSSLAWWVQQAENYDSPEFDITRYFGEPNPCYFFVNGSICQLFNVLPYMLEDDIQERVASWKIGMMMQLKSAFLGDTYNFNQDNTIRNYRITNQEQGICVIEFPQLSINTYYQGKFIFQQQKILRHGQGQFFQNNSLVYDGNWEYDQPHGCGILYAFNNQFRYEGDFFKSILHGEGTLQNNPNSYSFYNYLYQEYYQQVPHFKDLPEKILEFKIPVRDSQIVIRDINQKQRIIQIPNEISLVASSYLQHFFNFSIYSKNLLVYNMVKQDKTQQVDQEWHNNRNQYIDKTKFIMRTTYYDVMILYNQKSKTFQGKFVDLEIYQAIVDLFMFSQKYFTSNPNQILKLNVKYLKGTNQEIEYFFRSNRRAFMYLKNLQGLSKRNKMEQDQQYKIQLSHDFFDFKHIQSIDMEQLIIKHENSSKTSLPKMSQSQQVVTNQQSSVSQKNSIRKPSYQQSLTSLKSDQVNYFMQIEQKGIVLKHKNSQIQPDILFNIVISDNFCNVKKIKFQSTEITEYIFNILLREGVNFENIRNKIKNEYLTDLIFHKCDIKPEDLEFFLHKISNKIPNLVNLDLSGLFQNYQDERFFLKRIFTDPLDDAFNEFAKLNLRYLKSLDLSYSKIKTEHVKGILKNKDLVSLKHLDFSNCYFLQNKTLKYAYRYNSLKNLKEIEFACNKFGLQQLNKKQSYKAQIQKINLSGIEEQFINFKQDINQFFQLEVVNQNLSTLVIDQNQLQNMKLDQQLPNNLQNLEIYICQVKQNEQQMMISKILTYIYKFVNKYQLQRIQIKSKILTEKQLLNQFSEFCVTNFHQMGHYQLIINRLYINDQNLLSFQENFLEIKSKTQGFNLEMEKVQEYVLPYFLPLTEALPSGCDGQQSKILQSSVIKNSQIEDNNNQSILAQEKIENILKMFHNSNALDISNNEQLDKRSLGQVLQQAQNNITYMDLSHSNLDDEICNLISRFKHLQELKLNHCEFLTANSLILKIITQLPNLQQIHINKCKFNVNDLMVNTLFREFYLKNFEQAPQIFQEELSINSYKDFREIYYNNDNVKIMEKFIVLKVKIDLSQSNIPKNEATFTVHTLKNILIAFSRQKIIKISINISGLGSNKLSDSTLQSNSIESEKAKENYQEKINGMNIMGIDEDVFSEFIQSLQQYSKVVKGINLNFSSIKLVNRTRGIDILVQIMVQLFQCKLLKKLSLDFSDFEQNLEPNKREIRFLNFLNEQVQGNNLLPNLKSFTLKAQLSNFSMQFDIEQFKLFIDNFQYFPAIKYLNLDLKENYQQSVIDSVNQVFLIQALKNLSNNKKLTSLRLDLDKLYTDTINYRQIGENLINFSNLEFIQLNLSSYRNGDEQDYHIINESLCNAKQIIINNYTLKKK